MDAYFYPVEDELKSVVEGSRKEMVFIDLRNRLVNAFEETGFVSITF